MKWIGRPIRITIQWLDSHNGLLTALATIAIAALTYFVAVYANGQLKVLSDQLTEMRGTGLQTDKIIETNNKLAEAAVKQADASIEAAKTARESMIANQRAWIGPRNARSDNVPEVGKELSIFLDYQNTGREPAIETVYDVEAFVSSEEDDKSGALGGKVNAFLDKCKIMWRPAPAQVIFPNIGGLGSSYALKKTLRAEDIDQEIVDGHKFIILTGCFVYKTVNSIHRSSFCYYFKAKQMLPGNWNICTVGNDAD